MPLNPLPFREVRRRLEVAGRWVRQDVRQREGRHVEAVVVVRRAPGDVQQAGDIHQGP